MKINGMTGMARIMQKPVFKTISPSIHNNSPVGGAFSDFPRFFSKLETGVQYPRLVKFLRTVLTFCFCIVSMIIANKMIDKVKTISHLEILKRIHRQALKCMDIKQFQDILNGVLRK